MNKKDYTYISHDQALNNQKAAENNANNSNCNDTRIVNVRIKQTLKINRIVEDYFSYPEYDNIKLRIDKIKELELTENKLGGDLYDVEKISAVFKIVDNDCKTLDIHISKDMRDKIIKNLKFDPNSNSLVFTRINLLELIFMDPEHNEKFILDIINSHLSKTIGDFKVAYIEEKQEAIDDGILLSTIVKYKEYEAEVNVWLKIDFKQGVFNVNILKDNEIKPLYTLSEIFLDATMKNCYGV